MIQRALLIVFLIKLLKKMLNHKLIEKINNSYSTIIWFTENTLSNESISFDVFNYLFDGLLGQKLKEHAIAKDACQTFHTKNFGKDLWLIQCPPETSAGDFDEQMALIKNNVKENPNKILVINHSPKNWEQDLLKKYSQFEFELFSN